MVYKDRDGIYHMCPGPLKVSPNPVYLQKRGHISIDCCTFIRPPDFSFGLGPFFVLKKIKNGVG